jgi:SNF2 family DNA or RNA helicase
MSDNKSVKPLTTQTAQYSLPKPVWNPHGYQEEGVRVMLTQACAGLLMDPGLGKTSTVLSALKLLKSSGINKKLLVIAPLRVCYSVWPREVQKWANFAGLTVNIIHGPNKEEALHVDADIHLINPEAVPWLLNYRRKQRGYHTDDQNLRILDCDVLCVDESTKFKNGQSIRSKCLRRHLGYFKRRYILTGTIAPNGLMDLFGQIYILDEGLSLGRYITGYRNKFFYSSGYGGYTWTPKESALEEIQDAIDPYVLRIKGSDWLELPELITDDIKVQLPKDAMRMYKEIENHFFSLIADTPITAGNAAAAGVKCRQIANGAIYGAEVEYRPQREVHIVHDAKIDATVDLVEQLQGQPALLIYEFDHDRQRLQEKFDAPAIGGGTSAKKSDQYIRAFAAGDLPLLIGHPASMGHGIDGLQDSCRHIIMYGITWNLEHYLQTIQRVHRQGNTAQTVILHRIIAENTLDEVVVATLYDKEATQEKFLVGLRNYRSE